MGPDAEGKREIDATRKKSEERKWTVTADPNWPRQKSGKRGHLADSPFTNL